MKGFAKASYGGGGGDNLINMNMIYIITMIILVKLPVIAIEIVPDSIIAQKAALPIVQLS